MRALFRTIFFEPLYNVLVWLAAILPGHDLGLAIISLTLLVKFILLPLQHRVTKTQKKLKELEGDLKAIKEKHKGDNAEQARATMELYRAHGINPFAGLVVVIIQLPILFALFYVFRGDITVFNQAWLYSFISAPTAVNAIFLGVLDLSARSIPLAILAGITQYLQIKLALPPAPAPLANQPPSLRDDLARSMNMQMRYVLPGLITIFSLGFPSAVVLYWVTSNCFGIAHELVVRRRV